MSGVVSAASWASPVAAGSVVAIFGSQLANVTASASGYPLPTNIKGTSVTVNGVAAPLYFVSPGQINAQMPSSIYSPVTGAISASLRVTSPVGASPAMQVSVTDSVPGVFTSDATGCGGAAVLNVNPAGTVTVNSPSNSAQPGDYLAIFGTGFGQPVSPVTDGAAAPVIGVSPDSVTLGATVLPDLAYDGLAPSLSGVDQINLRIAAGTQEGCAVPLAVQGIAYGSPMVSVSVHTGRGQCADPAPSSYGRVTLTKTAGDPDSLTAVFPFGPNVQAPLPLLQSLVNSSIPATVSRSCAVPGITNLSAGAISIQGPNGTATVSPQAETGGVAYQASLPGGFIQAGTYTISSAANQPVSFSAMVPVDAPIQLQTSFAPGTVLSASEGVMIQWTGGNPNDLVRVELIVPYDGGQVFNTYVTTAGAGSIALLGLCDSGNPLEGKECSWGIPMAGKARIVIDVLPAGDIAATSGTTQFSWDYRYVFDSLVLSN